MYIDVLEDFYLSTNTMNGAALTEKISRADLWALAAVEAIQYASENSICNRPDCTSPNEIHPPIMYVNPILNCI